MTSDSSDDDLPPPSVLFDRLLAPKTPRKQAESSSSRSINKPTLPLPFNPITARSKSSTPVKEPPRQERRSSPRLAEKRVHLQTSSLSPPPRTRRDSSPLAQAQDVELVSERQRHSSLAEELFPPSPPPLLNSDSAPQIVRPRSPSVISDSEAEAERIGARIDQQRKEGGKCGCEEAIEGRRRSEGTIVSDSEAEAVDILRKEKKESRKKTPRKPRVSHDFTLSSSDDEAEGKSRNEDEHRGKGKKLDQDSLVNSFNRLDLTSAALPSNHSSLSPSPFPPSPFRSHPKPSLPPSFPLENPTTPRPPKQYARTPHRRRITISIASSSSSSSEDSDSPTFATKKKTRRSHSQSGKEEQGEVLVVETDDDDEVLPIVKEAEEPNTRFNGTERREDVAGNGGGFGYRGMQDVWENDGVLIYEPTPKKRPTKLALPKSLTKSKPSPSPSPFLRPPLPSSSSLPLDSPTPSKLILKDTRRARTDSPTKPIGASKRRVEIDLTGSSSSSEDDLPPPSTSRLPPPSSRLFPSTPTATSKKSSAPSNPATRRRSPSKPSKPRSTPSSHSSVPLLTPSDRSTLPLKLIRELDKLVFRKKWEGLRCLGDGGAGLPDGLEVIWNVRLLKTAGRAKWKQIKSPGKEVVHKTTIELATKVTDTEQKLKHTLAHELCHIAAWILSKESTPPHGNAFKLWAKRIMLVRNDIEVTTTHDYQIVYKYRWQCSSSYCGKIFGRHSNSINPSTHGCPCGGKLRGIDKDGNLKKIREVMMVEGEDGTMMETPKKRKSPWLEFVASQSPIVRKEMSGIPQSEVLKVVAERWKVRKEEMARTAMRETNKERGMEKESEELAEAFGGLKV